MAVCCVDPQPQPVLPPSDAELMRHELGKIKFFMIQIQDGKETPDTYNGLAEAVTELNEIIISLDNANDFYKIGGFLVLVPLLSCPNEKVVATTAELIADLCQNNKFCQTKVIEFHILPELVKLLSYPPNSKVCSKALYALSCLCRNNDDSIKPLEGTNIVELLIKILQESDEKLRAKTAFFLSYLSNYDNFREALYTANMIPTLISLLDKEQDSSTEHLLSALRVQVYKHVQSRVQCASKDYNLKEMLLKKIDAYGLKGEHQESKEHCSKILTLCFSGDRS